MSFAYKTLLGNGCLLERWMDVLLDPADPNASHANSGAEQVEAILLESKRRKGMVVLRDRRVRRRLEEKIGHLRVASQNFGISISDSQTAS